MTLSPLSLKRIVHPSYPATFAHYQKNCLSLFLTEDSFLEYSVLKDSPDAQWHKIMFPHSQVLFLLTLLFRLVSYPPHYLYFYLHLLLSLIPYPFYLLPLLFLDSLLHPVPFLHPFLRYLLLPGIPFFLRHFSLYFL